MIFQILEYCMNNGVTIMTAKDGYTLGNDIQSKVMAFAFGLSAEIEREMISRRTKEALALRKAQGVHIGRVRGSKNSYNKITGKEDWIKEQLQKGIPKAQIARIRRLNCYGGEIPKLVKKLQKYSSDFGDWNLRGEPSWVSEIKIRYDL